MTFESAQTINILLVEDDELNQRMFSFLLDRLGYSAEVVFNGAEAVAAVKTGKYDLVFMDISMPVMDGLEATRHIRNLPDEHRNIPIIAITASDLPKDIQHGLEAGMNGYIAKPLDFNRIRQVLDAFVNTKDPDQGTASSSVLLTSAAEDPLLDTPAALPGFDHDQVRYKQFLKEFYESLPERLAKIEQALGSDDWKTVGNEAHNIKSISAYLGAVKLTKLATRLDLLADDHVRKHNTGLFEEIKEVVSALMAEIGD